MKIPEQQLNKEEIQKYKSTKKLIDDSQYDLSIEIEMGAESNDDDDDDGATVQIKSEKEKSD